MTSHRAIACFGLAVSLIAWTLAAGCRLSGRHAMDPSPGGCAECHPDVVRQWAGSAHAAAWSDPLFVRATDGRRWTHCLPCHAPKPLLDQSPDEPPKLREDNPSCGVDCGACHQRCDAYTGPYRSWGPHPTERDRTRLACSSFCGVCHAGTAYEHRNSYLASLGASEPVRECADCHMPTSTSRLTQGHVLSYTHPKRAVRDHSFPVWTEALLRGAVEVSGVGIDAPPSQPIVADFQLTNRGAGHCIPTGHFGQRRLVVRIELVDRGGAVLDAKDWILESPDGNCLHPGKPAPFSARLTPSRDATPSGLRLRVERVSEDRDLRHTLVDQLWPIPSAAGRSANP